MTIDNKPLNTKQQKHFKEEVTKKLITSTKND